MRGNYRVEGPLGISVVEELAIEEVRRKEKEESKESIQGRKKMRRRV